MKNKQSEEDQGVLEQNNQFENLNFEVIVPSLSEEAKYRLRYALDRDQNREYDTSIIFKSMRTALLEELNGRGITAVLNYMFDCSKEQSITDVHNDLKIQKILQLLPETLQLPEALPYNEDDYSSVKNYRIATHWRATQDNKFFSSDLLLTLDKVYVLYQYPNSRVKVIINDIGQPSLAYLCHRGDLLIYE
ncbi:hypothetical protein FHS18_001178 [Paenibacillus phyllosphaerae]|uniref:Uncharacterized protein n=1 Tax=Paenibacillus phyllosphaerae TaxID=274593 RepID=A0A7W5AVN4_9BACL|nr:hypothetical protein [Paenibacillus phyllosphaerae]MBB3109126.1 hypothetical protein [Paenibacillus phyllosphaerae]